MAHGLAEDDAESDDSEIARTMRELVAAFGAPAVAATARHQRIIQADDLTGEQTQQSLRAYTLMLLDSRYPRAIAQIVARLCELDTAVGREFRQEDIAREIGVTKAQVCNLECDIAKRLNLPRRSSEKARQSAKLMNLRNYADRHPITAAT